MNCTLLRSIALMLLTSAQMLLAVCLDDSILRLLPTAGNTMRKEYAVPHKPLTTSLQKLNKTSKLPSPTTTLTRSTPAEESITGITITNNLVSPRERLKIVREQFKKERTGHLKKGN